MKNELSNNGAMPRSRSIAAQNARIKQLSTQDQNVAWLTARLFSNQKRITGIENRSLMVSIKVSNMERYENFKLQVYKKFLKALTDMKVDVVNDQISMLVCGDVEGSRSLNVDRSTMLNPYEPHYHLIIVFPISLWDNLQGKLHRLMFCYANHLADLEETKFKRVDVGSKRFRQYFWWKIYDDQVRKKLSKYKYSFPLGKIVSYSTKADLISNKLHLTNCQPSTYPYDLLLDESIVDRKILIFNKLAKRQLDGKNKGTFI